MGGCLRPFLVGLGVVMAVVRPVAAGQSHVTVNGYTLVGVPLVDSSVRLASDVARDTFATAVYRFDGPTQTWQAYTYGGTDFAIVPGMAFFVFASAGRVLEMTGEWTQFMTRDLAVGFNLACVPPARPDLSSASALLADIPYAQGVWRWDGAAQAWSGYLTGLGGDDFAAAVGTPFLVAVSAPTRWPVHRVAGDYLVVNLAAGPGAIDYPVTSLTTLPALTDEYRTTKLLLRRVAAGTFAMGSPTAEVGRYDNENLHTVTLTRDFYMGVFEVTQKQWERLEGNWPSSFDNETYRAGRPVEHVSFADVCGGDWEGGQTGHFLPDLRARTGLAFDLPTEAQWEYACRAGTGTALNSGKDITQFGEDANMGEVGRYWYNGGQDYDLAGDTTHGTATVGSYLPNTWGFYDMHGNVREWTADGYEATLIPATDPTGPASADGRVLRGGAWGLSARDCRSATRVAYGPANRGASTGFRVCLTVPAE